MSGLVTTMLEQALEVFKQRDLEKLSQLKEEADKVDFLQEHIAPYLTRLSEEEMNEGGAVRPDADVDPKLMRPI